MMSRVLLAMGYLRILEGTPKLALETFQRAAGHAHQAGDLVAEANAWLGQAELLAIEGDFLAAEDAVTAAGSGSPSGGIVKLSIIGASWGDLVILQRSSAGTAHLMPNLKRLIPQ